MKVMSYVLIDELAIRDKDMLIKHGHSQFMVILNSFSTAQAKIVHIWTMTLDMRGSKSDPVF